jgi:hygromycin-B 4-O-kinase
MAQKPTISAQDTLQFLQARLNQAVEELTLLTGGDWSQAYSFVHQQKKYVLRWCHSSETFEKDTVAGSFSCEAMPVPKVIDSGVKFETHFAITEFAQGKFINTLNAAELTHALPALFNLFDALRTADISSTTGYGGWNKDGIGSRKSWKAYLLGVKGDDDTERFTSGWYAHLAKSAIGTRIFDELYSRFETLVEKCPEVRELIHSDLLNYNLLVLDSKISGVIDWQCSLYGDALYDVAWFIFYEPWFPEFARVQLGQQLMAHFETVAANNANLKARLLCYQLHIGLDSIIYNTFKKDWQAVQEVADYTLRIALQTKNL